MSPVLQNLIPRAVFVKEDFVMSEGKLYPLFLCKVCDNRSYLKAKIFEESGSTSSILDSEGLSLLKEFKLSMKYEACHINK